MSLPPVTALSGVLSSQTMRFRATKWKPQSNGFTLVELLVGVAVGSITLGMVATIASRYNRSTDTAIWAAQTEQDYGRISRLMATEIREACLVQVSGSPGTTATPPVTPCTPASVTPCTTAPGTALYLLVPLNLANGTVSYRVISYTRNTNQLRRTGPPITATGALSTAADVADVVLMDNLVNSSTGFVPRVNNTCTSATIQFQFAVPNLATTLTREIVVSVGSPSVLN
jgi:prepilin-type N-terminal cleavage/methylation domain-containing protein